MFPNRQKSTGGSRTSSSRHSALHRRSITIIIPCPGQHHWLYADKSAGFRLPVPCSRNNGAHVLERMVPEIWKPNHGDGGNRRGNTDQLAEKYATQTVGNVEIGWTKYLCDPPADKSWWDKFAEGFEELIGLIASLVNNVADAYNGVKVPSSRHSAEGTAPALPSYRPVLM